MRRPLLIGLFALAVAALLFAVLRGGDESAPDAVDVRSPESPADEGARAANLAAPPTPSTPRTEATPPADPSPEAAARAEEFAPEELEEEFDLPDPVQKGDCTLGLSLVDAATRLPAAGTIYLWRLGAPGNEDWTEGDQLQETTFVPGDGTVLYDLPAGAYRARCGQEADGGDDPPAFVVDGPHTEVVLEITLPAEIPVYLRLFDETGWEIQEAEVTMVMSGTHPKQVLEPGWRVARRPRPPNAIEMYDEEICDANSTEDPWPLLQAGPDGFHVGTITGENREMTVTLAVRARVPGRSDVRVEFSNDRDMPVHLVSTAVDREWALELLELPDRSSARGLADVFEIESGGIPVADSRALPPWDQVPVRATLRSHPHLADFEVRFTLRDGFRPQGHLRWREETDR